MRALRLSLYHIPSEPCATSSLEFTHPRTSADVKKLALSKWLIGFIGLFLETPSK